MELRRPVSELGLKGVSVDPEGFRKTPDHRRFYPIYETAAELEIPVIVTVGPVCGRFADPWAMDIVAEDFPEVNFVMSHGTYPHVPTGDRMYFWRRRSTTSCPAQRAWEDPVVMSRSIASVAI